MLGALSGAILTGGVWLAGGLPEELAWAGGLAGLIAGGMMSFIVFKAAVVLFTSLGGSTLTVVGILAILYRYILAGKGHTDQPSWTRRKTVIFRKPPGRQGHTDQPSWTRCKTVVSRF